MTPQSALRLTIVHPEVGPFKGISATERHDLWERSRFEWRVGDAGNPALLVRNFLQTFGLGVPPSDVLLTQRERKAPEVAGATLFVSAAGGAAMIGVSPGLPSPVPAVPDVVAVVYGRRPAALAGPTSVAGFTPGAWRLGGWQASWSPAEHAQAVRRVREAIGRGDVYQVNLVGHASAPYDGDPLPALRRVTELPGARYPYLLTGDGWALGCASPEMLLQVSGGYPASAREPHERSEIRRYVETRPIKGTRPATAAGRRELLASPKERAEHIMIVDLERNDLAHVAAVGTVVVPELFRVRRWCDLWQAESRVRAELAPGVDLAALLMAVCPGGSVTGAPKIAALAEIERLEPVGRGPSMGALGWISPTSIDLGLTIRTVAADSERLHIWAGGGITWDSDPDAEVAEAAAKAAPLHAALRRA